MIKVVIASDHNGYKLKEIFIKKLQSLEYKVENIGTYTDAKVVNYTKYSYALANIINNNRATIGILIGESGMGLAMAANRHNGIRASLCHDVTTARLAREHLDANVLVLGAHVIGKDVALDCLKVFLESEFDGGFHADFLSKMDWRK